MTYYLVMFIQPTPVPNMGAIKIKLSRAQYENICSTDESGVDCGQGNFSTIPGTKRIFAIEIDNSAFVVVDVKKNRKE